MISSALELLALEVISEQPENPLSFKEGQFICYPADISVHKKVNLQDTEVNESIQENF